MNIRIKVYSRARWINVGTVIGWRAALLDLRNRRAEHWAIFQSP